MKQLVKLAETLNCNIRNIQAFKQSDEFGF